MMTNAAAQIRANRHRAASSGFTMIEIVVAIAIVAIVSGAAMLTLGTISPERELKRPAVKMKVYAREALSLARSTQRPHSIIITPTSFVLRETFLNEELLEERLGDESPKLFKVTDEDDEEEQPELEQVVERFELDENVQIQFKRIFDKEWQTPKNFSWNFYTSGICDPMMIRFDTEHGFIEMDFNPLTAKLQLEGEVMEIYTEK